MNKIRLLVLAVLSVSTIHACSSSAGDPVSEVLKFTSDGELLEGTLHLPGNEKKYPLAVFIHGSGRATRNDYEEFVVPLLHAGIAVFRYDKRGVGSSGGSYNGVSPGNSEYMFRVLGSDAVAAINHLKNDGRIDSEKVILIGGSQAGWIIPNAIRMTDVWLSVCISGPAVSVGEEIFYSDMAEQGPYSQQEADEKLGDFNGIKGYDPVSNIEKMKRPSLWVFGGKDVSIPVKKTISILENIKEQRNLPLEIKLYPGADHGLYNIEKQEREPVVEVVIEWIKRKL